MSHISHFYYRQSRLPVMGSAGVRYGPLNRKPPALGVAVCGLSSSSSSIIRTT